MKKLFLKNKETIIKYSIKSLLGLISIFVMLFITNKCLEIQEREDTRDLVEKAFTDIYECRQSQIGFISLFNKQSDSSNFWTRNRYPSISQPETFNKIFESEIVLTLIDKESLESIRQFNKNSHVLLSALDVDSLDNTKAFGWLYNYGVELWKIEEILTLTIEYLDNEITKEELSSKKLLILRSYLEGLSKFSESPFKHPWMIIGK